METIQQDITQSMRGMLVDWLVEVSIMSLPEGFYLSGLNTHAVVKYKFQGCSL
jgi:hypothetical protein